MGFQISLERCGIRFVSEGYIDHKLPRTTGSCRGLLSCIVLAHTSIDVAGPTNIGPTYDFAAQYLDVVHTLKDTWRTRSVTQGCPAPF